MANAPYKLGMQAVWEGEIDLLDNTIKAVLVDNTYAQNLTTDEFLDDISAYVLDTAVTLSSKSVTLGVFDAADVTFGAVAGGDTAEAVVIYKDTGVEATSRLLFYIDTITGFPLATNGGDITVTWSNGSSKIAALGA